MLQQQLKLMEALTIRPSNSSMDQSSAADASHYVDHIASSITEFLYDPQAHIIFASRYNRYEDLFSVNLAAQDNAWKVRLLLRKLGPAEHERYANFILPKNPREVTFKDTVQTLSQMFGEQSSHFKTQFQRLQLCKRDSDDFITTLPHRSQSIRSHGPNRGSSKCTWRDLRHPLAGTVARGISTEIALSASIAAKAVIGWDTVMGSANQYQLLEAARGCYVP
ncbi:hypothetical protein SprV_0501970200 [Sparganum proliferum]